MAGDESVMTPAAVAAAAGRVNGVDSVSGVSGTRTAGGITVASFLDTDGEMQLAAMEIGDVPVPTGGAGVIGLLTGVAAHATTAVGLETAQVTDSVESDGAAIKSAMFVLQLCAAVALGETEVRGESTKATVAGIYGTAGKSAARETAECFNSGANDLPDTGGVVATQVCARTSTVAAGEVLRTIGMGRRVGAGAAPRNVMLLGLLLESPFGMVFAAEGLITTLGAVGMERITTGVDGREGYLVVEPNACARARTLPAGEALRAGVGTITGLPGGILMAGLTTGIDELIVAVVEGVAIQTCATKAAVGTRETVGIGATDIAAIIVQAYVKFMDIYDVQSGQPVASKCACTTFLAMVEATCKAV